MDHDFNYLRSLEQSIVGASNEGEARGIGITNASAKGAAKARLPGTTLERYLTSNRITVDRAPLGMSRQKTNQTRSSKKGNVIWTVEWIGQDDGRYVDHDCTASESIVELFRLSELRKNPSDQLAGKKRKRKQFDSLVSTQEVKEEDGVPAKMDDDGEVDDKIKLELPTNLGNEKTGDDTVELETAMNSGGGGEGSVVVKLEDPTTSEIGDEEGDTIKLEDLPTVEEGGDGSVTIKLEDRESSPSRDVDSDDSASSVLIITESSEPSSAKRRTGIGATSRSEGRKLQPTPYFYLLKPGTTPKARVLIPLDSQTTLTDALRDRTIQEYPTLYALRDSPAEIRHPSAEVPANFILETDYLKCHSVDQLDEFEESEFASRNEPQTLDANAILNMLRRDVST